MTRGTFLSLLGAAFGAIPVFGQGAAPAGDKVYDVRNGDQNGKLVIGDTDVQFESLTDSKHSRRWKYTELREVSKPKKELRIKPLKGSRYDFQFKDGKQRDEIYKLITDRVLAARRTVK